jgi:hypothetical protein
MCPDGVNISTKPVNIDELRGPYRQIDPFKALLQEFNKKFGELLPKIGLSANELDAFEIKLQDTGEPVSFMKHVNLVIKSQSSKSLQALINYFQKIENDPTKLYSDRITEWQRIASVYKINKKNYNKDSRPQKIVFDPFEKGEKKTTDIAAGPIKVIPQDDNNKNRIIKETGNASSINDNDKGIKLVFKQDWLINKVLLGSLGYGK